MYIVLTPNWIRLTTLPQSQKYNRQLAITDQTSEIVTRLTFGLFVFWSVAYTYVYSNLPRSDLIKRDNRNFLFRFWFSFVLLKHTFHVLIILKAIMDMYVFSEYIG